MFKMIVIAIIGVACFLHGLQACAADDAAQKVREDLAYSIGVQAYIYAYPMMDLWRTFYEGTLDPNRGQKIGLNQFNFSRKLVTPKDDWAVGDRTEGLVQGDDGSITVTISAEEPKDPQIRANWLPAPKGAFYMALREYSPEAAILTREWEPPGVKRIK